MSGNKAAPLTAVTPFRNCASWLGMVISLVRVTSLWELQLESRTVKRLGTRIWDHALSGHTSMKGGFCGVGLCRCSECALPSRYVLTPPCQGSPCLRVDRSSADSKQEPPGDVCFPVGSDSGQLGIASSGQSAFRNSGATGACLFGFVMTSTESEYVSFSCRMSTDPFVRELN